MFGFKTRKNMRLNFIRGNHATIALVVVLLIFENVFYLEKSVCYYQSCAIFHFKHLCLLFV